MNLKKNVFFSVALASLLLAVGCQDLNINPQESPINEKSSTLNSSGFTPLTAFPCTIIVTDYGIVANDDSPQTVDDNTTRFKALVDSLKGVPNRCPYIIFPEGIFYGIFNIPEGLNDMSIIGFGIDATVIKMAPSKYSYPGSGGVVSILGERTSISALTIDGNGIMAHGDVAYAPIGDGYVCLHVSGKGSVISGLKIIDSYNKQCVVAADQVQVKNTTFISNQTECTKPNGLPCVGKDVDGVHIYGETDNYHSITIENCTFQSHQRAGVFIEQRITGVNILNNNFNHCTDGINQQGRSSDINIIGNTFNYCNGGIYSQNGLGTMTIDGNTFYVEQWAMQLRGGVKYTQQNTNTGLPFTTSFNGIVYQKLGHKIEFINNTVEFVNGSFGNDAATIIGIQTYTPGLVAGDPANESQNNYVQEFVVNNNIFKSNNVNRAPDIIHFSTHHSPGHGFVNKMVVSNNRWEHGLMGSFLYEGTGTCLTEVRVLQVTNNLFKNMQGCTLQGDFVSFEDNTIHNNPYDAAFVASYHADIFRNTFYASPTNPTRSKRLVINRHSGLFDSMILHQGQNIRSLNGVASPTENYIDYGHPCL